VGLKIIEEPMLLVVKVDQAVTAAEELKVGPWGVGVLVAAGLGWVAVLAGHPVSVKARLSAKNKIITPE
jgi:hypothetical protein